MNSIKFAELRQIRDNAKMIADHCGAVIGDRMYDLTFYRSQSGECDWILTVYDWIPEGWYGMEEAFKGAPLNILQFSDSSEARAIYAKLIDEQLADYVAKF